MRWLGAAGAVLLTSGLLVGFTQGAASAADPDLIAREGRLVHRVAGLPAAGSATSQQFESATARQDISGWRVQATVVLRAAPGPGAQLKVGFGTQSGSTCVVDAEFSTPTTGAMTAGFSRSGRTITLSKDSTSAFTEDWSCAAVALGSAEDGTYDELRGTLTGVYGKPALAIGPVTVLGKAQSRLKLVKGDWTVVEVTVSNSARYNAPGLRVTGGGPGLKVKPAAYDVVYRNGGKGTLRLQVKLAGKQRKSTLRLSASSRGVTVARAIPVKRVKPAKKPANGRYRATVKGSKAKVTFRIKKGKVAGFKGQGLRMRCQTPGDYAQYQSADLRYPTKAKIARSGRVDATHEWRKGGAWYNARLRMSVKGAKVEQGDFTYVTANWCSVNIDFTARRVGR